MSGKDRAKADEEGPDEDEEKEGLCKGCGRKGKRLPFFRLRKSKKLLQQKRKQKGICVNSRAWGRNGGGGGGGGGWCCLCLRQPKTLNSSSGESPTSDPNSSDFSFDMMRALIEKNDFYSKECNPHFDAAADDHHI